MEIISENWLEIFGVVGSLLYIYLEIKQKSSLWVVGFFSSAVYVVVFYRTGLYAFSALYSYYMVASVYGIYCWRFAQKSDIQERPVIRLKKSLGVILSLISLVLFAGIGYVLDNYIDSSATPPYFEALPTALSIVATWMLARKILEHWIVWIFVNFFSSALYFWCQLYPTSVLFIIYGILSITGWLKWRLDMKKENKK